MIRIVADIKTYHNSLISNLANANREVALEVMSKSGYYVATSIRKAMDSKLHHWKKVSHHKVAFDANRTFQLGVMEREEGNIVNPGSLSKFIGWINYERNELKPTTVVAEAFQTHYAKTRQDGKVVGHKKVKGTGKRTQALIDRIDQGRYGADYVRFFGENYMTPKAYHFKREGYNNALPDVTRAINSGWSQSLGIAIGRTQQNAERIRYSS